MVLFSFKMGRSHNLRWPKLTHFSRQVFIIEKTYELTISIIHRELWISSDLMYVKCLQQGLAQCALIIFY